MYSYLLLGVYVCVLTVARKQVIKARAKWGSRPRPSAIRQDSFHGF